MKNQRTYYVLKSSSSGMFMRKYIRTYSASDLDNAEIFRSRGAAASARSTAKEKDGAIVKIEVNFIE
jgi:hypothetical protein